MSDSVIRRLDKFVIELLDAAEGRRCDTPAGNDTSGTSEDNPGSSSAPVPVPITERVAVLKAAVGYLSVRNKLTDEGNGGGQEDEETPEIVRFEQRIKSNRARRR